MGIDLAGARDTAEATTEAEEDRLEEQRGGGNKTTGQKNQEMWQHQQLQSITLN